MGRTSFTLAISYLWICHLFCALRRLRQRASRQLAMEEDFAHAAADGRRYGAWEKDILFLLLLLFSLKAPRAARDAIVFTTSALRIIHLTLVYLYLRITFSRPRKNGANGALYLLISPPSSSACLSAAALWSV